MLFRSHPHCSYYKMCTGDLKFDIQNKEDFLKSLKSLEHMYETINYGSAYNHGARDLLLKHSSENAVETLGVDGVKDLNYKSSTLEKL